MLGFITKILLITTIIEMSYPRLIVDEINAQRIRKNNGWIFLDRMVVGKGFLEINIKVQLKTQTVPADRNYRVTFAAIPEADWDTYAQKKCAQNLVPSDRLKRLELRLDHTNKLIGMGNIRFPVVEQRGYHFVLMDCPKSLINQYFNKKSKLLYTLDLNNSGSNVGSDEGTYSWLLPLLLVLNIGVIYLMRRKDEGSELKEINYPRLLLQFGVWCNVIGLTFIWVWYLLYSMGSGEKSAFLDFCYLFFSELSTVFLMILIGFLGYGWATIRKELTDEEIYMPLTAMGGFISVLLTMLTKITEGEDDRFHMFDTIPTYIQIVMKLILYIVFLMGIIYSKNKKTSTGPIRSYFNGLTVLGTIVFLMLPVTCLAAEYIDRCYRQAWVIKNIQIIKSVIICVMAWQQCSKKSLYRKVTLMDRSFMEQDNKLL